MSVIKIGNRIVQSGDSGYQPEGVKTFTPQRRQLKTASEIPDNRQRFIANQAQKAANQQAQFLINQANRRSDVETAMRFAPETLNRSDFTGFTGGVLGLRTGNFQDTGIPKLREGLTSDQYANYMRGLYSINPQRMETMFPVASGAALRNLSRFVPGIGTLQSIAGFVGGKTGDAIQGLKQIAINKGILPPTTLNPNTGTTVDSTKVQNVSELDSSTKALIAPNVNTVLGLDEDIAGSNFERIFAVPGGQTATYSALSKRDPLNKTIVTTRGNYLVNADDVGGLRMMSLPTSMAEGGLASINNPEYTMLRRASDFDI